MARTLPPGIADKLLDKLSSDDDFRAHFQDDATAALASLGYHEPVGTPSNDSALACMACDAMPTKESFAKSRDAYRKQLTSQINLIIFKI